MKGHCGGGGRDLIYLGNIVMLLGLGMSPLGRWLGAHLPGSNLMSPHTSLETSLGSFLLLGRCFNIKPLTPCLFRIDW